MATFLARAFGYPAATGDYFVDDGASSHEDDINRIAEAGVAVACGTDRYCPDAPMRRDQMAAFLEAALRD